MQTKIRATIKKDIKTLPKPPAYSVPRLSLKASVPSAPSTESSAALSAPSAVPSVEPQATPPKPRTTTAGKSSGRAQTGSGIRDWSKVNRGINNGAYGAPRFWTDERRKVLKELREQGLSFAKIGEEFNKSADACRRQWYYING